MQLFSLVLHGGTKRVEAVTLTCFYGQGLPGTLPPPATSCEGHFSLVSAKTTSLGARQPDIVPARLLNPR